MAFLIFSFKLGAIGSSSIVDVFDFGHYSTFTDLAGITIEGRVGGRLTLSQDTVETFRLVGLDFALFGLVVAGAVGTVGWTRTVVRLMAEVQTAITLQDSYMVNNSAG